MLLLLFNAVPALNFLIRRGHIKIFEESNNLGRLIGDSVLSKGRKGKALSCSFLVLIQEALVKHVEIVEVHLFLWSFLLFALRLL